VKIVVATDRSETAREAVAWAGDLARHLDAELVLVQVLPESIDGAEELLRSDAEALPRARAVVRVDRDIPDGVVRAAEAEDADLLVVGNAGMGGRRQFLLDNIPNRISHSARCNVLIVNTSQASVPEPPPVPAVEGQLLERATRIARVLVRFARDARATESSAERARLLRQALEQLGPTFSKLGQVLSSRPDLLPPEVIEELSKLQSTVTPLTEEQVVRVMEEELRVPWEDVFASIDPEPLAAGTIGQVHRATLESGERVVVKVQRPNAREDIMRDLGLLELLAEKAQEREGFRETVDIPALVLHLSDSLRRELDFLEEAANIERMREVLAPYDRLAVPRVLPELSTSRLLVLEFVEGVSIARSEDSPERRAAARQLLEAFYRQLLADGFFHADPHPGNLLWADGRIYLLDLGMVGQLGPELRELMILLLLAFSRSDAAFLAEAVLLLSGEGSRADLDFEALERDFQAFIDRFQVGSLRDIQIGPMLEGMMQIASRHGVRLPASLALSGKAFGQIQLVIADLDSTLDPFRVASDFLLRNVGEQLLRATDPRYLYYEGQKLKLRVVRLVESLERAAGARPGPNLEIDIRGTTPIEAAIARAGRSLALAAVTSAGIVGAAFVLAFGRRAQR
jgi:predicted unusual protein kinase regulating ubiquinone biosynthesis (AarF/ABC1/UbiB family)/nucleotide-binding universal stress UspA family protein